MSDIISTRNIQVAHGCLCRCQSGRVGDCPAHNTGHHCNMIPAYNSNRNNQREDDDGLCYGNIKEQTTLEGSRRWAQLVCVSEAERRSLYPSLEEMMPDVYK